MRVRNRRPARPREIPLRRLIPNALTTLALCAGLAGMHYALKGDAERAVAAIGVAALLDSLDGRAARLLRATSPFGVAFDSLCDLVSFGVAPALVLYHWQLKGVGVWGLAACVAFVICSAVRLARFTAAHMGALQRSSPGGVRYFSGLPTPAAAGAVLVPEMLTFAELTRFTPPVWATIVYTILISGMMVSRIPMFSGKGFRIDRRLAAPLLATLALGAVLATADAWLTACILAVAYPLTAPLSWRSYARARRAAEACGDTPVVGADDPDSPVISTRPFAGGAGRSGVGR
ncbi:MAG: phosphatidylcholine/phosphatidylserine synthase [Phycisphaerae bacterium]|nr:phosphatidylcholine/phosphatidylserine synthase [Phycisphaerae bacterium]